MRKILETIQPISIIRPDQTRLSSIINEALQSNDEFLHRWGNNPPSIIYEDVANSRIKSPLKQPQRLEGREKHWYKYQLIRSKKHVHWHYKFPSISILLSKNSSYPNFGIEGSMASTTPVTILSFQLVLGLRLGAWTTPI